MKRRYTDKEVAAILKQMGILVDTREKEFTHIETALAGLKCPVERGKLDQGDYTAIVPMTAFEGCKDIAGYTSLQDEVLIERKASIDELAGNFTVDRERFEREFIRAKANGAKVFLLIESCSWEDIFSHNYRSRLNPKSLYGSLLSWQSRYNITVIFCKPSETAKIIYGILYYWLKNKLEM